MAVYKDKERNTWYVDLAIYHDGTRTKIKKRGFISKRDGLEWEREFLSEKKANGIVHSSLIFRDILKVQLKSSGSSEDSKKATYNLINKYCPEFMDTQYKKITKLKIMEFRNKLSSLDLATRTKNKIISRFKAVCKYAYKFYDLEDVSKTLDAFKTKVGEEKEMNVWSVEEFNTFLECVRNDIYATFFRVLFYTGMRRGEALALQKDDLRGNVLNINKSIKHFSNGFIPPKTNSSIRKIQIDDITLSHLLKLKDRPGNFFFGDYSSLGISNIQREFTNAIKLSGVKSIRIHDLRHSHATLLINNGVNIVAVSKRLGHSNINMTLKVYTHLLDQTNEQLIKTIDKLQNVPQISPIT